MPQIVSTRYANAFADLLLSEKATVSPESEIAALADLARAIHDNADFRNVLLSPAVPPARKRTVMQKLAPEFNLSPLAVRFLMVIVDHGRIPLLTDILDAVRQELDARRGILRAKVTSAVDLTPDEQLVVQNNLSRAAGKEVRAEFQTDPAVLGGIVARIGSTIYDGSLRGQLQALRHQFAGQSS